MDAQGTWRPADGSWGVVGTPPAVPPETGLIDENIHVWLDGPDGQPTTVEVVVSATNNCTCSSHVTNFHR